MISLVNKKNKTSTNVCFVKIEAQGVYVVLIILSYPNRVSYPKQDVTEVKHMSDTDHEKRQFDEFKGVLSGSMKGLRSGIMADEVVSEKERHEKEKKEQHKDLYEAVLNQIEQAYTDLINNINNRLDAIHKEMEANRQNWDVRANRLEAIDEVLEEIKNGKSLNKSEAQKIIKSAGHSISNDATTADYYTLLVAIKTDDLKHIDVLDDDFLSLEKRERFYLDTKTKADAIHNDQGLDNNQKLAAYENLKDEMNKADFILASRKVENEEQKSDVEIVSKNDYGQQRTGFAYDISGMNF